MDGLQIVAGIGRLFKMVARLDPSDDVTIKLGRWTIDSIKIDKNLQTTVDFKSDKDYVQVQNCYFLIGDKDEPLEIKIKLL